MVPTDFEKELGREQVIYEEQGILFAWGRHIKTHLGEERFQELRSHCNVVHLGDFFSGLWAVVTKENTKDESIQAAIEKYGEITNVKVGPRGGFQYVTYGETDFWGDEFNPLIYNEEQTESWRVDKHDSVVEWDPPSEAMKALARKNKLKKAAKARKLAKKK